MKRRILSVDDSASMRQLVAMTLEGAGYDVDTAVDGQDALGKVGQGRFDLVITDLNMPHMDGISLIRALRARTDHRYTPIVMLTTESQEAKKQEGRAAGATGWIVKPFEQTKLLAVVKKLLG